MFISNKNQNRVEKIPISMFALKKFSLIAKIMGHYEFYSYVLSDIESRSRDNKLIIRDIYVPSGQKVTTVECKLDKEETVSSILEMSKQTDRVCVGWAHSHGYMEPFHSNVDQFNFEQISKYAYSNNKISSKEIFKPGKFDSLFEKLFWKKNKLLLKQNKEWYSLAFNQNDKNILENFLGSFSKSLGFNTLYQVYSLVIGMSKSNSNFTVYGEVLNTTKIAASLNPIRNNQKASLVVYDLGESGVDENKLIDELSSLDIEFSGNKPDLLRNKKKICILNSNNIKFDNSIYILNLNENLGVSFQEKENINNKVDKIIKSESSLDILSNLDQRNVDTLETKLNQLQLDYESLNFEYNELKKQTLIENLNNANTSNSYLQNQIKIHFIKNIYTYYHNKCRKDGFFRIHLSRNLFFYNLLTKVQEGNLEAYCLGQNYSNNRKRFKQFIWDDIKLKKLADINVVTNTKIISFLLNFSRDLTLYKNYSNQIIKEFDLLKYER